MTAIELLGALENLGYKVIAFPPEVIQGVDKEKLDLALVEGYWSVLEDIGKDLQEAEKCAANS